jgi:hypothetical protein
MISNGSPSISLKAQKQAIPSMTEEKRINPIIEENKSGLQQEEANANQSIMMLSDVIRYSKSNNNSEVENDYDLDVDAKGTILLLAELWRIQDIIHNCSRSLRRT